MGSKSEVLSEYQNIHKEIACQLWPSNGYDVNIENTVLIVI